MNRSQTTLSSAIILVCASLSSAVLAQTVVVPPAYANKLGDRFENIPFVYTPYVRHQQMLDKSLVPLGVLHGMAYRPVKTTRIPQLPDGAWSELRIILADSTVPLAQMSSNYDANLGTNKKEVFRGKINTYHHNPVAPTEFSVTIPYQNTFLYLGQNPLVVDLHPEGKGYQGSPGCPTLSSIPGGWMDAVGDVTMRRMIGKATPCGPWPTGGGKFDIAGGGYVMKFFTQPILMPYGKGCTGSHGKVPTLAGVGATTVGNQNFALSVTNVPTSSKLGVLVLGLSSFQSPNGTLPLNLGFMGAANCWQNAANHFLGFAPFIGSINLKTGIPNNNALKGASVFTQFAIDDPAGPHLITTQGGLIYIR